MLFVLYWCLSILILGSPFHWINASGKSIHYFARKSQKDPCCPFCNLFRSSICCLCRPKGFHTLWERNQDKDYISHLWPYRWLGMSLWEQQLTHLSLPDVRYQGEVELQWVQDLSSPCLRSNFWRSMPKCFEILGSEIPMYHKGRSRYTCKR